MPTRGRPPLAPEEVEARVRSYCERYQAAADPDGLPPFPSGRRETRQHREWLGLYKARQRLAARSEAQPLPDANAAVEPPPVPGSGDCALCGRALFDAAIVRFAPAPRQRPLLVHPGCAELLRAARDAGRPAVSRLEALLWPPRRA